MTDKCDDCRHRKTLEELMIKGNVFELPRYRLKNYCSLINDWTIKLNGCDRYECANIMKWRIEE